MEYLLGLALFVSIFCVVQAMRCDTRQGQRAPQGSHLLIRNETYCSHYSDFWSWPESSYKVSGNSTGDQACNSDFSGNFPKPLEIVECSFTSKLRPVENGSKAKKKECSDECFVLIKMLFLETKELELCYEGLLGRFPTDCEKYLPQLLNSSSISECNFDSKKEVIRFKLPNSKLHVCKEECISDIKLHLGKFHQKRTCYEDLLNVDTIAASIRSMNFAHGVFKLNSIKPTYFKRVLDKVYKTHFVNLAIVIENQEKPEDRYKFVDSLYEKMRNESDLRENKMIILKKIVDDEVSRSCIPVNISTACIELQKLRAKVENHAGNVLNDWESKVRRNNFNDIIEFGSPPTLSPAGYAFHQVLSRLIDKSMGGNLVNLKNTFAFVKKLRWNMHKYEALSKLKSWLSGKNDRFQLLIAFEIKEALENLNGPDPKLEAEKGLHDLKLSYPECFRNVVWNPECRIYTNGREYLFSPEDEEYDFSPGIKRVFTWAKDEVPPNSMWRFEKVEKDAEIRFLVRNVALGKYLCAYNDFKVPWTIDGINIFKWETVIDDSRRYASLADNLGNCEWYIDFDNCKSHKDIYLQDVVTKEYFYASKYKFPTNDYMRYPLLWKPGERYGYWHLTCKTVA